MTMRRYYYWPHMAHAAYKVGVDCQLCAHARGSLYKHQRYLKLFPEAGPLEFVAMDLLGPVQRTASGDEHLLVITDRFSKTTRAIPMKSTTAVTVAKALFDHWVDPYGAPFYVLTDYGPQFVDKFFEAVCSMLGLQHYLKTAYHPQTNGQAARFNKTIAERLRHYVAEHQRD